MMRADSQALRTLPHGLGYVQGTMKALANARVAPRVQATPVYARFWRKQHALPPVRRTLTCQPSTIALQLDTEASGMLKEHTAYQDLGADYFGKLNHDTVARRAIKRHDPLLPGVPRLRRGLFS